RENFLRQGRWFGDVDDSHADRAARRAQVAGVLGGGEVRFRASRHRGGVAHQTRGQVEREVLRQRRNGRQRFAFYKFFTGQLEAEDVRQLKRVTARLRGGLTAFQFGRHFEAIDRERRARGTDRERCGIGHRRGRAAAFNGRFVGQRCFGPGRRFDLHEDLDDQRFKRREQRRVRAFERVSFF